MPKQPTVEEIDELCSMIEDLIGILLKWKPEHVSDEDRQTILQAMYRTGILTDPRKTVASMVHSEIMKTSPTGVRTS